jgi:hypothetical protein
MSTELTPFDLRVLRAIKRLSDRGELPASAAEVTVELARMTTEEMLAENR